jgi:hypothetical protein
MTSRAVAGYRGELLRNSTMRLFACWFVPQHFSAWCPLVFNSLLLANILGARSICPDVCTDVPNAPGIPVNWRWVIKPLLIV